MNDPLSRLRRFLRELKRRNVYKVAVAYLAVAFVGIQAAQLLVPPTTLPGWADDLLIYLAVFGFPIALVVAWAFEMTPEGMRRTSEAKPGGSVEEEPESAAVTRTPYKVLVGLGLVAAAAAGGWYLTGGGGESPEVTEGTVAVLPFQVSGSASEEWRDGMVSLVSTGLDGAAGLRAIPDQTVLATWEQSGPDRRRATVEQSLATARRIGARYGVVGTVTGLGSELQLSAAAYETTSGDRLGQVEVTGPPDSVTALGGELTRRVMGLLASETGQGLEAADLASVMTRSDTALKAFLAGERHSRAVRNTKAIESYQAAIRADSGFALPYARLAFLGIWREDVEDVDLRQARELSDQLPPRQRRLVRALYLAQVERRTLAAADSLRRLTEDYPDDPTMWDSRAELILHEFIPRGWPEIDRAYQRAVELDPGYTAYYGHYVEAAFRFHHDSAIVAERLKEVPNEEWQTLFRLARDAIHGDSATRQRAVSAFDTVSIPDSWLISRSLSAPQDAVVEDTVYRRVLRRGDADPDSYAVLLTINDLEQGRVEQALSDFRQWEVEADLAACLLMWGLTLDQPVPDSTAAQYLAPQYHPADPSPRRLLCTGFYLVERDRGGELKRLIRRLRTAVDTTEPGGWTAGELQARIQELRGYRAWKRGDLNRAAQLWDRSNESFTHGAIWRGDLYRERGQLDTAEGWYAAAWSHPIAHERFGQLYEEMGEPEKAAAAYRRFIAGWKDADPELQPRVEAARKRVQALTAEEAETDE